MNKGRGRGTPQALLVERNHFQCILVVVGLHSAAVLQRGDLRPLPLAQELHCLATRLLQASVVTALATQVNNRHVTDDVTYPRVKTG